MYLVSNVWTDQIDLASTQNVVNSSLIELIRNQGNRESNQQPCGSYTIALYQLSHSPDSIDSIITYTSSDKVFL